MHELWPRAERHASTKARYQSLRGIIQLYLKSAVRYGVRCLLPRFATAVLLVYGARAQVSVSEITASTDPPRGVIRPFETAVVQVQAYGAVANAEGKVERVRLEAGGVEFRILDRDGGWLSKPFAQPAADRQRFTRRRQAASRAVLDPSTLNPGAAPALRDSVLFTAPGRPGVYRVEAALEGKNAAVTLRVEAGAPSLRPPEKVSFDRERHLPSLYRKLAEHYAPFIAQETWFDPKADFLARFDFDGNWRGDDNWESTPTGSSQAYVYYAAMETRTHWFLIYNFFHPRNYAERCILGTCHENDNEGLILTVQKDGSKFGRLQVMETLAHNRVYSYHADRGVQDGLHRIAGDIEFFDRTHPVVDVEPGGHGVFGSHDSHSHYSFESGAFAGGTGVTYIYEGTARRPKHANDRRVGYDLLPIYEHWWLRGVDGRGRRDGTFDDYCVYQPKGDRPGSAYPEIPCSFLGRAKARNRAKPFWGWFDLGSRAVLAIGQWGLDPAYAVSQTLRFPAGEPFSVDYVSNPFLLPAGSPRSR